MCCLWSKNAYLAISREKNNENIERTLKPCVSAYYTGIFDLINIIDGSEKWYNISEIRKFHVNQRFGSYFGVCELAPIYAQ